MSILVAAVLAGCGSSSTPSSGGTTSPTATATVTGSVVSGPSCPVAHADTPCPDRPVGKGAVVARVGGHEAGRGTISSAGRFQLSLPPGSYELTPEGTGILTCATVEVPVAVGQTTPVTLRCDTGIR
ncbi:MAG: carboxypeptidase regulatory-like protein [Acidimicrobiales bacterium]|nr:carboxypeptidase regulatory-like protein [Acidimicrobiales bacterium]